MAVLKYRDPDTGDFVEIAGVSTGGGTTDVSGLLTKTSSKETMPTADLNPTNGVIGRWDVTDDGTSTFEWPDRFSFRYNGVRTGAFNEYGEIRADAAKPITVAMRAHGNVAGSTGSIFEVATKRGGNVLLKVAEQSVNCHITNTSKDTYGLIVNRTQPATETTDPDTFQVQYLSSRQTWTNEKGCLRTSNVNPTDPTVAQEDAFKIIGANSQLGNYLAVIKEDSTPIFRIGALGRMNTYFGQRLVGDTIEFRDSTEARTSTVGQVTGGDLVINPHADVNLTKGRIKEAGQTLWRQWSGTQAQYDALGTYDPNTLYVVI